MSREATANLLGAVADAVHDQQATRTGPVPPLDGTAAAALSALRHFLDRPRLEQLRDVLGLSHSGAVRLVDRLTAQGWVRRSPGADGRSRAVELTPAGRRRAEMFAGARASYLSELLADLSDDDVERLHELLGRVVDGVVQLKDGGAWICRRCDLVACGRADGECPTARAAARKYGLPH